MPPKCFKCGIDASVGDVAIWDNGDFLWVRDSISEWEEWTRTWKKLPNAIWSRWNIEACNVYCKSCWKNWAQFVKPGRKYALSRSCEEMAIKARIQFDDCTGNLHPGNPFYCPHCHRHFNHGAASLEKHLFQCRHTVAVKRKQRDVPPPQMAPPPQMVPRMIPPPQMAPPPQFVPHIPPPLPPPQMVAASTPVFMQQLL